MIPLFSTTLGTPANPIASPELKIINEEAGPLLERIFFRGPGQTDSAISTDGLFFLIWWLSVFFFVVLMALMFYWVVKYRRRPGVPAPTSPSHNTPLEVFWTVVPSSSLLVIFLLGFWGYMAKVVSPTTAIELNIVGWKWDWSVEYPGGEQTTYLAPLGGRQDVKIHVLPEDTPIRLRMTSNDVIHSFWVPDFRLKMDVYPNRYSGYGFTTPKLDTGEQYRDHWVFCAEYCGDLHSEMAAVFRVVKKADYNTFLIDSNSGDLPPVELGAVLHKRMCAACHSVDGSANVGPTWLNAYGYPQQFTDGTSIDSVDANYIRESILVPGAKVVAGYANQMPSFQGQLNDDELDALVQYYRSLSDRAPETPDLSEEGDGGEGAEGETPTDDESATEDEEGEAQASARPTTVGGGSATTAGSTP